MGVILVVLDQQYRTERGCRWSVSCAAVPFTYSSTPGYGIDSLHRPARPRLIDHASVQAVAQRSTGESDRATLENLFRFVRDDVRFGFTRRWNDMTASAVIAAGVGQCTTEATLPHALCKASGLPSRIHYALIDADMMHGFVSKGDGGSHARAAVTRLGGSGGRRPVAQTRLLRSRRGALPWIRLHWPRGMAARFRRIALQRQAELRPHLDAEGFVQMERYRQITASGTSRPTTSPAQTTGP